MPSIFFLFHPLQANRRGHGQFFTRRAKQPGVGVSFENHDRIAFLVGGQQKFPVRRDEEVARLQAQRGLVADQRKRTVLFADAVDGQVVEIAAVGHVEEFPVRRQVDVRAAEAGAVVVRRGAGDGLQMPEPAVTVTKNLRLPADLEHEVGVMAVGMENEVTRASARRGAHERLGGGLERPHLAGRLEVVDHYFVRAKIRYEQLFAIGREVYRMHMRCFLTRCYGAGALVHDLLYGGGELTVLMHGKHGKAAPVIIAGEHEAVARVRTDVAGTRAGRLMIDEGEGAGVTIEGIRVHAAGTILGKFAGGVKEAFVGG